MSQLKERFESLLQENNFVTEQLVKLEEKTGVRRELIAIGRSRWSVLWANATLLHCNWQPGSASYLLAPPPVLLLSSLLSQSSPSAHL